MRKMIRFLLIPAIVVAILMVYDLYRSNKLIETEQISLEFDTLPQGFDGFRIAHVSDLHGTQYGADNSELCKLISEQNVDIIVITGDYVDNKNDLDMVYGTAKALCEVAPVYFVAGNHEYGSKNFDKVEKELVRAGVVVLQNEAVELERNGDKITLLGVDDPAGRADMISMERAVELAKTREPEFLIVLHHRYDRAEEAAELDIDLFLTGHAHGGLIRLPFTDGIIGPGRVVLPKRTSGYYNVNGMDMVTSRGLGNSGISFRLFNRVHLPIIDLHRG